jgi:hypothetical protein
MSEPITLDFHMEEIGGWRFPDGYSMALTRSSTSMSATELPLVALEAQIKGPSNTGNGHEHGMGPLMEIQRRIESALRSGREFRFINVPLLPTRCSFDVETLTEGEMSICSFLRMRAEFYDVSDRVVPARGVGSGITSVEHSFRVTERAVPDLKIVLAVPTDEQIEEMMGSEEGVML